MYTIEFTAQDTPPAGLSTARRATRYLADLRRAFEQSFDVGTIPPPDFVHGIITSYLFGLPPERYWGWSLPGLVKETANALFSRTDDPTKSVLPYSRFQLVGSTHRKVVSDVHFVYVKVGLFVSAEDDEVECLASFLAESRGVDPLNLG